MDGGAPAFLDLQFHTRNAPRMPGRSDEAAMADPGMAGAAGRVAPWSFAEPGGQEFDACRCRSVPALVVF